MKLIHLTGAAAAFTVLALTAPAAISPAAAQGAPGKMSELPSGLKYTDSKVGDGAAATTGHKVSVHYTGWLTDGKKFDSRTSNAPLPPIRSSTSSVFDSPPAA